MLVHARATWEGLPPRLATGILSESPFALDARIVIFSVSRHSEPRRLLRLERLSTTSIFEEAIAINC